MKTYGKLFLDRNIFEWYDENFGVSVEPFTKREALLWLLSNTSYKEKEERTVIKKCDKEFSYVIYPGEFYFSLSFLQEKWNWKNKMEVSRFLEKLVKTGTLVTRILCSYTLQKGTMYNVLIYRFVNWEKYQKLSNSKACTEDVTKDVTEGVTKDVTDNQLVREVDVTEGVTKDVTEVVTTLNIYKTNNKISLKETIKENPAEVPSDGASPSSESDSCESQMRVNENSNLNSNCANENSSTSGEDSRYRSESSLDPNKKLSPNLRIKKISSGDLIRYCNSEILNKNLGKDEEDGIRKLYSQYAPENQETILKTFALKLLNALNEEFALKFKKKYASKISSGNKNPFTVNDILPFFYGKYSKKSVEEHKKEIENFYAKLELQGFKAKSSGNNVSLPAFVTWLEKNLQLKTREQEAPFTKEDLKKALPNEDEKVMERLEAKYDRYFKKGNWTTNKGNDVDLDMFTGFLRKTVIEELISEGYVPKENKNISRDGRKWFRVEDADEIIKKYSGRSKN